MEATTRNHERSVRGIFFFFQAKADKVRSRTQTEGNGADLSPVCRRLERSSRDIKCEKPSESDSEIGGAKGCGVSFHSFSFSILFFFLFFGAIAARADSRLSLRICNVQFSFVIKRNKCEQLVGFDWGRREETELRDVQLLLSNKLIN